MIERTASCRCGQLQARCTGDPVRVSVCHCLACQQRTGSAFAAQARWPERQVVLTGTASEWHRTADSGNAVHYRFCAQCGSTLSYTVATMPGLVAIPVGAFADPNFPAPAFSVREDRKHAWVAVLGDDVAHEG